MTRRKIIPFSPLLVAQLFPGAVREYKFHPTRRWRFDIAWTDGRMVALEYDGGIFNGGRHTRPIGYDKDAEKLNTAAIMGWTVLRITPLMWRDGRALQFIEQAMDAYNKRRAA